MDAKLRSTSRSANQDEPDTPGDQAVENSPARQLNLLSDLTALGNLPWPDQQRFPHNRPHLRYSNAHSVVSGDLSSSKQPLIVTGYTSLDYLIDFLGKESMKAEHVRVLIGTDPMPTDRRKFTLQGVAPSEEIKRYWLEQRAISLLYSAQLIKVIEMLKSGRAVARISPSSSRKIHAKMFIGDEAATLGSSNFSRAGMLSQIESNARFTKAKEAKRYQETKQFAELYWQIGADYTDGLIELLQQMLQPVTWQEALARACAELLEGRWADEYLAPDDMENLSPLWPTQKQGIAQALWILENIGSVLVADATGSGKTRMGAHLIRALRQKVLESGRARPVDPVLICPPNAVQEKWRDELSRCGINIQPFSHGVLSNQEANDFDNVARYLRKAQVLAVDEAHNFLNASQRTAHLLGHMADHTVLFTATPISKDVSDILAVIDLLGADNFDEQSLKLLKNAFGRRNRREVTDEEMQVVRAEVQRFMVRRTKKMFNAMIDSAPDLYRDSSGRCCRYPYPRSEFYRCDEDDADRQLAAEIRQETKALYGIVQLPGEFDLSQPLRDEGWTEERYLSSRLRGAKALAGYHVTKALRSSRAALIEHIAGTRDAVTWAGLRSPAKAKDSGDIMTSVMNASQEVRKSKLSIPLPSWLADPEAFKQACVEEIATYERILALCKRISDRRERSKANHLQTLLDKHTLVLAFDSTIITLAVLKEMLENLGGASILVASGANRAERRRLAEEFNSCITHGPTIALCSDSMSEGVNLQSFSAVVHLDMPSVPRIAEQRQGRIERMDSPHENIEVWWPRDSREFELKQDELLVARLESVRGLIGHNMSMPDQETPDADKGVAPEELMVNEASWDGLEDAFAPIRSLVKGGSALVPPQVYTQLRTTRARVLSSVSVVDSPTEWAFLTVAGSHRAAPRFVFVDSLHSQPVTNLDAVVAALRDRLTPDVNDVELTPGIAGRLTEYVLQVEKQERLLLPRKKQRALEEMDIILKAYREGCSAQADDDELRQWLDWALGLMHPPEEEEMRADPRSLADCWLQAIRSRWAAALGRTQKRPLLLKQLRPNLLENPLSKGEMMQAFEDVVLIPPLAERVVAAIIGVVAH